MSVDPQNLLDASAQVLQAAPDAYADLAKPAVQQTGKFLARIPHAINAALAPIDMWIAKREYAIEETKKLLALKLQNIDPEKVVPPEPYVAVPAIQAISYCMDSEELREMYANLLAKSMNSDTKGDVHPAFVEIIKQLSPADAKLFKIICENPGRPVITVRRTISEVQGQQLVFRYVTWVDSAPIEEVAKTVDNLLRCELIEIPQGRSYTDKSHYDAIRKNEGYLQTLESVANQYSITRESIIEEEKLIIITELGKYFYYICIANETTE